MQTMTRHRTTCGFLLKTLLKTLVAALVVLCLHVSDASARRVVYVYRYYQQPEKAGLFMMNFRGGPAFGVQNTPDLSFLGMFGIDLGFAVDPRYNAYIILTPQVQFRSYYVNPSIPIGFQYDIRLAHGIYLYPRASIGYSAQLFTSSFDYGPFRYYTTDVVHGGILIPELGLKFVVNGRLNLGFEPFSLPIFFNSDHYSIWYRFLFFIGFNA